MFDNSSDEILARIQANDDLIHAAGHGRADALRKALAQGADVNSVRSDQGALMGAVVRRHVDCVAVLVEHGVDTNQKNRMWWTALHEAASKDYSEMVPVLVAGEANVNGQDAYGITPLAAAIRSKSPSAARALLDAGADVNVVDFDGISPLMRAVSNEDADLLGLLLARGADATLKDRKDRTAVDLATESGWRAGVGIIEQAGRAAARSVDTIEAPAVEPLSQATEQEAPRTAGISKIGKRKMG